MCSVGSMMEERRAQSWVLLVKRVKLEGTGLGPWCRNFAPMRRIGGCMLGTLVRLDDVVWC